MSKHEWEPFRAVLDLSLDRLIRLLTEAQQYLGSGNDLAAMGTLTDLDDPYENVRAALRLFKSQRFR